MIADHLVLRGRAVETHERFDVVVVGGGHAGAEAAWAAARMGRATALVTTGVEAIGRMSCNPAIGGIGKGHMVREIDALGGLMALATDRGGIQFRLLNRSKGPAVRALRAQADRKIYAAAVLDLLQSVPRLQIIEGMVDEVLAESFDGTSPLRAAGVRLADGRELRCGAVVITTGTFLRGLMHCGERQTPGGRVGEPAAVGLSGNLERLGLTLARLKTGTPPRIARDTVDLDRLQTQPGDDPPTPFSFMTDRLAQSQIDCWITHTNERTHQVIRDNIHRAPMYSGQIKSRGPRYCPSIEDKVMRFAEKAGHQIFLEPEGYDSPLLYCNGIPTSLPPDVQDAMVHTIEGCAGAEIVQYGYAVEYDWVPTDQIDATLQTKRVAGLFLAGQINGTSGYEEAAGQGLVAGVNAAQRVLGREPVVLGRDEAYVGVMIDDIVTRPPDEPYRMFTSRAEYRLHLRSDNADHRLTPLGRRIGLVDDDRWARFEAKRRAIETLEAELGSRHRQGRPILEWLRRPHVRLRDLAGDGLDLAGLADDVIQAVEIRLKYAGYLEREDRLIERHRQLEARQIPADFDFKRIGGLRFEAREKFVRFRPRSLGQAARISGISPADIATLSLYLLRRR
ncbi:MAG TPA: tRNA uridine-5-carboxymethylaminomethyl(34) synthesis enzyme MnmG [Phycisphaerae bacterium]|nr:tRNA uridine-5-carboxymethylaminomethyl(34) synthesis enzyme MnmG [Phycisphaerae bacterium]